MTVTDKWTGCLSRLDKSVHICMLLPKRMLLVMDENVGLCLYMSMFPIQKLSAFFTPASEV